jgi:hypothetical protein
MISIFSSFMVPDRPDMTRTINIMSGAELPDGQDTPLWGCPSVRGCFDDRLLYRTIRSTFVTASYLGQSSPVARQAHNLKVAG